MDELLFRAGNRLRPTRMLRSSYDAKGRPSGALGSVAQLDVGASEAERHWRAIERHRRNLSAKLGRIVPVPVATLDYFVTVCPRFREPRIVEGETLDAMHRNAITDTVTGLFNRHYFEAFLNCEVRRSGRYDRTFALILLDLDNFKDVNDRLGHLAGDEALRVFGEVVDRHLRGADIGCRFGGDEFAIILPDTPDAEAYEAAERLRRGVALRFRQQWSTESMVVEVSGGVASYPDSGETPTELVAAADRALYRAKREGGNRIARAPLTEPAGSPRVEIRRPLSPLVPAPIEAAMVATERSPSDVAPAVVLVPAPPADESRVRVEPVPHDGGARSSVELPS